MPVISLEVDKKWLLRGPILEKVIQSQVWGSRLAQWEEHATLDLRIVNLSPTWGVDII